MGDLSSPTRDRTRTPLGRKHRVLTTGLPGESTLTVFFVCFFPAPAAFMTTPSISSFSEVRDFSRDLSDCEDVAGAGQACGPLRAPILLIEPPAQA